MIAFARHSSTSFWFVLVTAFFAVPASAQCPKLQLVGPAGMIMADTEITVALSNFSEGFPAGWNVKWSVEGARLLRGEDKPVAVFEPIVPGGSSVDVKVSAAVSGPGDCSALLTESYVAGPRAYDPIVLYFPTSNSEARAMIDAAFITVLQNPAVKAYGAVRFAEKATVRQKRDRLMQVYKIIKRRGYDASKVFILVGPLREEEDFFFVFCDDARCLSDIVPTDKYIQFSAADIPSKVKTLFPKKQ